MMQTTVNTWVWGAGVALQAALLVMLVVRRVAVRLPMFTLLIGFYVLRSAVLFAVSGHVSQSVMGSLYDGSSLVDIALQICVVAEIAVRLLKHDGEWRRMPGALLTQGAMLLGMVAVAVGSGWAAGAIWQTRGRVSLDRSQMALAVLFVLLFAWAASKGIHGLVRREMEGFAIYCAVSLISQVERYRAAVTRNVGMYIGWSCVVAGVYLLVLVFWIVTMNQATSSEGQAARILPWRRAERVMT